MSWLAEIATALRLAKQPNHVSGVLPLSNGGWCIDITDEYGFACTLDVPDPTLAYRCQCGTKAQPWIDRACPEHGALMAGLRHVVEQRREQR